MTASESSGLRLMHATKCVHEPDPWTGTRQAPDRHQTGPRQAPPDPRTVGCSPHCTCTDWVVAEPTRPGRPDLHCWKNMSIFPNHEPPLLLMPWKTFSSRLVSSHLDYSATSRWLKCGNWPVPPPSSLLLVLWKQRASLHRSLLLNAAFCAHC